MRYIAGVFPHAANEKRYANLSSFNSGFETNNKKTSMYDEFPTKPMFSFDLAVSGT